MDIITKSAAGQLESGHRLCFLDGMREYDESPTQYAWIAYAFATMLVGGLAGYIIAIQNGHATQAVAATTASPAASVTVVDESELRAYREILARDPKNVAAAVKAGNLLYDGQRYVEAIGFYQ